MYFDVTYSTQLFIIVITISYKDFQVKVIFTCENLYGEKEEDCTEKTYEKYTQSIITCQDCLHSTQGC
jgi:hypothetical protein